MTCLVVKEWRNDEADILTVIFFQAGDMCLILQRQTLYGGSLQQVPPPPGYLKAYSFFSEQQSDLCDALKKSRCEVCLMSAA